MLGLDLFSCEVVWNRRLTESIYAIAATSTGIASIARPGQFVGIKCGDDKLLRRPISISQKDGDVLTFVFEVKGEGTSWLSRRLPGKHLDVLGPLGNGFHLPDGKIIVVGGGIGSAPLLFAAESSKNTNTAILGFRDSRSVILSAEFVSVCDRVYFATEDGSVGIHGTVMPPLGDLLESGGYEAVLACGPRPMLSAVADICKLHGIQCQVSMEERMACGIGACFVCACATVIDGKEGMSRVCKDGPVFDADEVQWLPLRDGYA